MVCPLCGSANVKKVKRCKMSNRRTDHFYICRECGILFEDVTKLRE
jgi:predicted RNA-binding Zn-ribbon protein involved in translation (DUF1610 family)